MEAVYSAIGLVGAACAVGMFAAVAMGRISADRPIFYGVNAVGAVLVLLAASHEFDLGDIGTIGQELIWALVSFIGFFRASLKKPSPAVEAAPLVLAPMGPRQSFGLKRVTQSPLVSAA